MPARYVAAGRVRRGAAGAAAGFVAAAALMSLAGAASARASTPQPNYHSGTDTATFTVTGILDRNCLVSTGGNKVYIKPGDSIDFKTSLVGVETSGLLSKVNGVLSGVTSLGSVGGALGNTLGNVLGGSSGGSTGGGGGLGSVTGGLGGALGGQGSGRLIGASDPLTGSDLAGLNVSATLDAKSAHPTTFTVNGGQTVTIKGLSSGTHTLNWTASSVALVPGALGSQASLPLSSSQLQSGAKMSWSGDVYVTTGAPDCRLAVNTPRTDISAGPIHVSVPSLSVTAPVDPNKVASSLPTSLPTSLPSTKGSSSTSSSSSSSSAGSASSGSGSSGPNVASLLPVPARVVPDGYGNGSGQTSGGGTLGGAGGTSQLSDVSGSGTGGTAYAPLSFAGSTTGSKSGGSATSDMGGGQPQTVNLAANKAPTAQLPVVLAIIAIIALSLVAATYARLFLLRRRS